MEDYSKELLRSGIIEAKTGSHETARRYLDRAIYMTSSHDVLAEAWFWMGEVTADPAEKRKALENCLSHDLRHARARRALAILDGKLKADEVINPDKLPAATEGLRQSSADRFMCPKCGGRMAFAPDGQTLVCDYCSRNQVVSVTSKEADEKDFIIAMATSRGHGRPLQEQVFHCNGCGAEFILPPNQISSNCAYCNSPHVVDYEKTSDVIEPNSILPFAIDQKRATQILIDWVARNHIKPEKKVDLPRGVYLPMWTFDLGGEIDYSGEVVEYEQNLFTGERERKVTRVDDKYPVIVNDLALPASKKLSQVFMKLLPTFNLSALREYDPRYLASWLAELYDVPMADASLDARSMAFKKIKKQMPHLLGNITLTRTSSASMLVESFKLILLPVWMTELPFDGREHIVLINGQSGEVASDMSDKDEEHGGLFDFLADLLND